MNVLHSSVLTRVCRSVFMIVGILLVAADLRSQQPADTILHNGNILTVDSRFSIAQAVAIRGNQFQAVGSNEDILKLAGPSTTKIDLKGKTAIPGLIDTHSHIYNYAEGSYGGELGAEKLRRFNVDWRGVKTKEDVLNQIKGVMQKYRFKAGEWIYLSNSLSLIGANGAPDHAAILWDELTRWELDKVTPNNPVALTLGYPDLGGFRLNSKAIDVIWNELGYADFIKRYGRYSISNNGQPEGLVEPPASRIVLQLAGGGAPTDLAPIYKKYIDELSAQGITTVSTRMPDYALKAYQGLESRGELTMRIGYGQLNQFGNVKDLNKELPALAKQVGTGSDLLWVTSVSPTAVDGTTGAARVCTNLPRAGGAAGTLAKWFPMGACQLDTEYRGPGQKAAPMQANYFRDWIEAGGRHRLRFANTHVSGDRSYSILLATMEQLQKQYGPSAISNWALDHCDMVNPADLPLAGRLKVTFSCYSRPVEGASRIAASYGEEVAHKFISPVKSMLAAGAKVVFEMDGDGYVWQELERFITRKDNAGKVWGAHERVDRTTTLKMITSWAADYVLRGDKLGSIEPGKTADLVVLNRDYMTVPEEEIRTLHSRLTILGGRIIYLHPDFVQEYSLRPPDAVLSTYEELKARRKPFREYSGGGG
jgi:predicted amidohydrolase YtcJ